MKTIAIVGVYVWGAMYAAGVLVAAIMWHDRLAVLSILGCAAAAYAAQFLTALALDDEITHSAKLTCWRLSLVFMAASLIAGAAAGVHLAIGG